jgi:adenosylcobinamide-phosphate synthase
MNELALILLAAFSLDLLWGDPEYPLHPVRIIGRSIKFFELLINRAGFSGVPAGTLLVVASVFTSWGAYLGVHLLASSVSIHLGMVVDVFLAYSCLALEDLLRRARLIWKALHQGSLPRARELVQEIVGRETSGLDSHEIARATIESVAENFVDGFLSPLFWFVMGSAVARIVGLPSHHGALIGVITFRVVNTLDSMVGYRNDRYLYFGRTSARLDDAMNFLPARLSIPIISMAATLCRINGLDALRAGLRDRLRHTSPNAGHAESAVAGALGIRLGGPSTYAYGIVERPWLGDGNPDPSTEQILRCNRLIFVSGIISLLLAVFALNIFL